MKQLYYVNGKKVDFNTYANALNAEITAEETRKEYEVNLSSTYKCNFLGADNKQ